MGKSKDYGLPTLCKISQERYLFVPFLIIFRGTDEREYNEPTVFELEI